MRKSVFHACCLSIFVLALLLGASPAAACTAGPCADGSTCSGTQSCSCAGGTATCTDFPPKECRSLWDTIRGILDYIDILKVVDDSGTAKVQLAAAEMGDALNSSDLGRYLGAQSSHDQEWSALNMEVQDAVVAGCEAVAKGAFFNN